MSNSNLSEADLKRNFEMYDRDRSGSITIQEMKQIYQQFGMSVNDQTLQYLTSKYDRDRSGTIGYAEFVEMITGRPPAMQYGGAQGGYGAQGGFGAQQGGQFGAQQGQGQFGAQGQGQFGAQGGQGQFR